MQIGLINELHGSRESHPTWDSILERAQLAEEVGFDSFVFEDALLYRGEAKTEGVWESVTVAAALLASTERIEVGHSVINSPYRSPAMMASIASSLDEVGAGRYIFGIGAGNTPNSDYEAFGFPIEHRYSRFAEAIQIIHSLLKTGRCDFRGDFYEVVDAELVLRGPRPQGPPINIAGRGPRMMELVNEYADCWNWWSYDEAIEEAVERLSPLVAAVGPHIVKTVDFYSVVPPGIEFVDDRRPLRGTAEEIVEFLLGLGDLGFSEVRVDLLGGGRAAIEQMSPVVDLVHNP